MREKNFVSAVVYIHNDASNIKDFATYIIDTLEANFDCCEVIFIDDASIDSSIEILKETVRNHKNAYDSGCTITLLSMQDFCGREKAISSGDDLAIGDFILEFDSVELDFVAENIMQVYNKCLEGFDIVQAIPRHKSRFTSKIFYAAIHKFSTNHTQLETLRFRILSRRALNRVRSISITVPYRSLLYATSGLSYTSVFFEAKTPIIKAISKEESRYRRHLALDTLVLFTTLGYKISLTMALLMMFIALFTTIYSIAIYLSKHPVAGWTTTMLFLSVSFFGVFAILSIVIKYLSLIADLVFRTQRVPYKNIEKLQEAL